MPVVSLHDRGLIEPILRRNVFLHIYALGDLDDFFWPFTTWYALEERGEVQAILLLYAAFETPTLMALSDPANDSFHELLCQARRLLPSRFYAHLSPGCRDALGPNLHIDSRGPHLKMALVEPSLAVAGIDNAV